MKPASSFLLSHTLSHLRRILPMVLLVQPDLTDSHMSGNSIARAF